MLVSRDNRLFAPWIVLVIAWALASPAAFANAEECACCGALEAPADDCCAGEPITRCDDAALDCCLIASLSDASQYAIRPATEESAGTAAEQSAPTLDLRVAPGVPGKAIAGSFAIAPAPRLDALAWYSLETIPPSPPKFLLHSVYLA